LPHRAIEHALLADARTLALSPAIVIWAPLKRNTFEAPPRWPNMNFREAGSV